MSPDRVGDECWYKVGGYPLDAEGWALGWLRGWSTGEFQYGIVEDQTTGRIGIVNLDRLAFKDPARFKIVAWNIVLHKKPKTKGAKRKTKTKGVQNGKKR